MANIQLIDQYIRDSGFKLQYIAQVLQISSNALHSKLVGQTQFKVDEAGMLATVLGLTMPERDACFFEVQHRAECCTPRPGQEGRRRNDR